MSKSRFAEHECPVARGLDQVGDWWTLLVVREVMYGLRHFEEIRQSLGISRAVLSDRLRRLTQNGILHRLEDEYDGRAARYTLSEKGRDLWPVFLALLLWSNRHVLDGKEDIIKPRDKTTGADIAGMGAVDLHGRSVAIRDTVLETGRDATPRLRDRIRHAF